jgi:hypothetical protein
MKRESPHAAVYLALPKFQQLPLVSAALKFGN